MILAVCVAAALLLMLRLSVDVGDDGIIQLPRSYIIAVDA